MTNKQSQPTCETDENGDKYWWINGNLHRLDGPAVEYANGEKYWYVDDKRYLSFYDGKWHDENGNPISETLGKAKFYQAVLEWIDKQGK